MELLLQKKSFEALDYLQNDICGIINHNDEVESDNFKKLARALFDPLPISTNIYLIFRFFTC